MIKLKYFLPALIIFFSFLPFYSFISSPTKEIQEQIETVYYHLSCPFTKAVYETQPADNPNEILSSAAIVSHHLLAREFIGKTLSKIKGNYRTIILVGPNHKNIGQADIQTTPGFWKTKFGDIPADSVLINSLIGSKLAKAEENSFNTEHSVCSLVSFVKIYFPDSKIAPLILKGKTSIEQSKALGKFLAQNCDNCLLLASIDFSHDTLSQQAEENDAKSIGILENLEEDNINNIVCDSYPSLQVLFSFLKQKGVKNGMLIGSSNSALVSQQNFDSVTSYIFMIFRKNQ